MKRIIPVFLFLSYSLFGQVSMNYYLPTDVTYNPSIPTPEQVLGYVPGEWHVSHDQLLVYVRAVAEASDRMTIENYAKSYEGRQLLQVVVTSPANHARLAEIKAARAKVKRGEVQQGPLVVQLGYSVHGNEASGANASLLTLYYLAAAQGAEIDKMLEKTVILVDPSYNPDGLNRFASWVNMHKSANINPDPNNREYDEPWPGGRTNHYWFDLNRDWLPVQHPESIGRIRQFHDWMPHILTDHHEMGTNGTFFFQPGIPSRKFPNTDNRNPELTHEIAKFHAAFLDSIGSLYYSKESFDDFYIGKGSTYPDVNGSIGILFEQASSRGHAQENPYGVLTFPFTIRNHFTTSLSTLKASQHLADQLRAYQAQQYKDAAKWMSPAAYVFGESTDPMKALEMARILSLHDIQVYQLAKDLNASGRSFKKEKAYVVPTSQPQARLIKSIFETRTSFTDSLFYDISTWTLPLAMNIPFGQLDGKAFDSSVKGAEVTQFVTEGKRMGGSSEYAYVFETKGYFAHRAIHRLQRSGILLRVLEEDHRSADGVFPRGSVLIPVGVQRQRVGLIEQRIEEIVNLDGIDVHALGTGYAKGGIDLGSPSMSMLEPVKVAVLVGDGVNYSEAGETWHLLDQRMKMQVTLLPADRVGSVDLSRYNRIVMANGSYGNIGKQGAEKLKTWLQQGGVIVAWKSAGNWLASNELSKVQYESSPADTAGYRTYSDYSSATGARVTGGSIFQASVDLTHPLCYGLTDDMMPLFRNHNQVMKKSDNPYAHPLVYTSNPLMSGYVHPDNLKKLSGAPAAQVSALGRGRVIVLADNPNFRAFWYGTNKLFLNALFFGHTISSGTAR